jgi:hypothetical protein
VLASRVRVEPALVLLFCDVGAHLIHVQLALPWRSIRGRSFSGSAPGWEKMMIWSRKIISVGIERI